MQQAFKLKYVHTDIARFLSLEETLNEHFTEMSFSFFYYYREGYPPVLVLRTTNPWNTAYREVMKKVK